MKSVFERVAAETQLQTIVADINQGLTGYHPFCLFLEGPMGAGKTSLIREILYSRGLDTRIPVASPTFTFMNEYQIGTDCYFHLDLHRIEDPGKIQSLGIQDLITKACGLFIEWPKPGAVPIEPTHQLKISYVGDKTDERTYEFNSF